ncbi:MAG: hypothetical protein KGI57_01930 [Hyphomicrobiales bacterium]|nr:hypothetical protein [Hyphomicrobiales bacterium]
MRVEILGALGCLALAGRSAAQTPTLIGNWSSPAGLLQFDLDGQVFARQLSGGTIYASFGRWAVNGDVLSAQFRSVIPDRQCDFRDACIPAMPMRSFSFRFRFVSNDEFVLGFDLPGPTDFRRMR